MGSTRIPRYLAITLLLVCAGPSYLAGQAADPKPADSKAKPADAAALEAEAIEVKGLVEQSAVPAKSNPDEKINWTAVKQGDKLTAGTQIRTGLRAHLVLRFGDASVVMIKRSTLASVDTFYRQGDTETVRLGLGYGAVRGGTTGGEVRSDFVVDSTVATLAKRGTEGWEFWVEPYTGRFRVSLAESGLVEALQRFTRQRRLVRPGEYANEANIATMWIKQDIFDRSVRFFAAESVSEADLNFNVRHPDGLAVLGPGLGTDARGSGGRVSPPPSSGAQPPRPRKNGLFDTLLLQADLVVRPEGH
ncbi:MAG: FecR domain-containing protein, partial [bacterium]|nr:FecR domain-containing protein [bacterium]